MVDAAFFSAAFFTVSVLLAAFVIPFFVLSARSSAYSFSEKNLLQKQQEAQQRKLLKAQLQRESANPAAVLRRTSENVRIAV